MPLDDGDAFLFSFPSSSLVEAGFKHISYSKGEQQTEYRRAWWFTTKSQIYNQILVFFSKVSQPHPSLRKVNGKIDLSF